MLRGLALSTLLCIACNNSALAPVGTQHQALTGAQAIPRLNTTDASVPDLEPDRFFTVGSTSYFVGSGLGAGAELWATDGTGPGTRLVRDIAVGQAASGPFAFASLPGRVVFAATEGTTGTEVWSSDGTRAGTTLVTDLAPGSASGFSQPQRGAGRGTGNGLTVFGGFAYFAGPGGQLTRTDGTAAGTVIVSSLNWAPDYDSSPLVAFNGELYGSARAATGGFELYAYSPADGGTRLVADLASGSNSSFPYQFTPSGGQLYFACRPTGSDLYACSTDGSTIRVVGRIQRVSVSDPGAAMVAFEGGLLVRACGGALYPCPTQLYRDGDAGFQLVSTLNAAGDSWASSFTPYNGLVYFIANGGTSSWEVWSTDGTGPGTHPVTALAGPGFMGDPSWSDEPLLVPFQGGLYFCGSADGTSSQLMKLDGTADGGASVVYPFASCGGLQAASPSLLLLRGSTANSGTALWSTDGTTGGTHLVFSLPVEYHSAGTQLAPLKGGVVFAGTTGDVGTKKAWLTDGTSNQLVAPAADPVNFLTAAGRVFFGAAAGPATNQLWVTDGTSAGSRAVADFGAAPVEHLSPFDGGVLFAANYQLWYANGSDAGTLPLSMVQPQSATPLDGVSLFSGYFSSQQLWKTDGTSAGTQPLQRLDGGGLYYPSEFARFGPVLLFGASEFNAAISHLWARRAARRSSSTSAQAAA